MRTMEARGDIGADGGHHRAALVTPDLDVLAAQIAEINDWVARRRALDAVPDAFRAMVHAKVGTLFRKYYSNL